jgi:hypothetical protein
VTVNDENGTAISGAAVSVTWTLPDGSSQSRTRTTNTSGIANIQISATDQGTYTITIDDIGRPGFTFDPENSVLSASITK